MLEHIVSMHPFVGKSYMDTGRDDLLAWKDDTGFNATGMYEAEGDYHVELFEEAGTCSGIIFSDGNQGQQLQNALLAKCFIPYTGKFGLYYYSA